MCILIRICCNSSTGDPALDYIGTGGAEWLPEHSMIPSKYMYKQCIYVRSRKVKAVHNSKKLFFCFLIRVETLLRRMSLKTFSSSLHPINVIWIVYFCKMCMRREPILWTEMRLCTEYNIGAFSTLISCHLNCLVTSSYVTNLFPEPEPSWSKSGWCQLPDKLLTSGLTEKYSLDNGNHPLAKGFVSLLFTGASVSTIRPAEKQDAHSNYGYNISKTSFKTLILVTEASWAKTLNSGAVLLLHLRPSIFQSTCLFGGWRWIMSACHKYFREFKEQL